MKKVLFVNGNYNDIPLVEAAKRLGYFTITSGNDPSGEAHAVSDKYCPCDYSDKEAVLSLAVNEKIDAICSCGNDLAAISASYVAEKLGLPGHDTYECSRIFHEKDSFKKAAEKLNLPTPASASFTELDAALEYIATCSFPQIVKPVDLGGGKGISIAYDFSSGREAVEKAFHISKIKHIVIEDYIEGTQHGFICYIKNKSVVFDYSTNDYAYRNPFMVWIGSGYPADGYEKVRGRIISDVEKLAEYSNAADGFLTIQYMMKDGKPYYLETMRRCLGNLHFKCLSRDLGIDMYELFVANELGLDTSKYLSHLCRTGLYSGFMGIYAERDGVLKEIKFDSEFEKLIFDKLLFAEPGYEITQHLTDKLGMVWFSFPDIETRKKYLAEREKLMHVELEE